jgi:hypothetical protein
MAKTVAPQMMNGLYNITFVIAFKILKHNSGVQVSVDFSSDLQNMKHKW